MQAEALALRCESTEGWLAHCWLAEEPSPTTAISLTLSDSLHGPQASRQLRAYVNQPPRDLRQNV